MGLQFEICAFASATTTPKSFTAAKLVKAHLTTCRVSYESTNKPLMSLEQTSNTLSALTHFPDIEAKVPVIKNITS